MKEIAILFFLIILNGFFSMAEIALVSVRKAQLSLAAKKGDRKASKALELSEKPGKFLSTVQIGITIIGILTGIYSEDHITGSVEIWLNQFGGVLQIYSETIATTLVLLILTFFAIVLGELLPKRIGLIMANKISRLVVWPMHILSIIAAPFIWLLTATTDLMVNIFDLKNSEDNLVTEDEIKAMMREGSNQGAIEEIEHDIVENVFYLGDRKVNSLMTLRKDIIWLDINDEPNLNKQKIIASNHPLPVCEGGLDKIKGVLFPKNMLNSLLMGDEFDLVSLAEPAKFIPERTRAYAALEMFSESKYNIAFVVDEFGGIEGMLSIDHLLEALVGDLETHLKEEGEIEQRKDGSYLIDASVPLPEFLRYFDLETDEEIADIGSFGGLVLYISGHIPKTGYIFNWKGYTFEVIDMDGKRVDKVLMTKETL